jgi:hypothetical protein
LPNYREGFFASRGFGGIHIMANQSKSSKGPTWGDFVVQLIEAVTEALTKLITTGTGTIVALSILAILAAIIWRAPPEVQQQVLPLLTGMLGVIIGRMLGPQETSPPKPPDAPDSVQ